MESEIEKNFNSRLQLVVVKTEKNQHRSADQTTHIIPRGPLDEKFFMPARIEPTLRGTGNCRTTVVAYRFKPIQKRHIKIALIFLFIQHQFGNPWALLQPCTNQPAIDKEQLSGKLCQFRVIKAGTKSCWHAPHISSTYSVCASQFNCVSG